MSLAERQEAFMASVLDDGQTLLAGWTERHVAGLDIYRNNYRTALVEALASTFERTQRWVGAESFHRAAAHHLITHPPTSWTLDDAGKGFDETLVELFPEDPEVAELAWLEWAMHRAFVAADRESISAREFAAQTTGFTEEDWAELRLRFLPGLALRAVNHDVGVLWNSLADQPNGTADFMLAQPRMLLVWREQLRPTFALLDPLDGEALTFALGGACFGELCVLLVVRLGEEAGVARAGALLGHWLGEGLVACLRR
ncbi:DNA-binding domain-containing protein [Parerythrobacter aestuarii]|uniref:DNA-binding domain-containing protein n=1 Tax=Parerythrobacter aestuarii TaxID=3020909 RepID=UPI0024DE353F|nr:DNA-binding domain-containing protein [Parerythrobacter aestuarii]